MKASRKLAALAERELPHLLENVIVEDGEKYRAFGKYTIQPRDPGFDVSIRDDAVGKFSTTKSALAWCIADRLNYFNLARQIQELDQSLTRLRNDIYIRKNIADRMSGTAWETVITKVSYRQDQSQLLEQELTKCINLAKYWQLRGNSDETKRTGRNTPHTTNR